MAIRNKQQRSRTRKLILDDANQSKTNHAQIQYIETNLGDQQSWRYQSPGVSYGNRATRVKVDMAMISRIQSIAEETELKVPILHQSTKLQQLVSQGFQAACKLGKHAIVMKVYNILISGRILDS
jgi:hypothetical protein